MVVNALDRLSISFFVPKIWAVTFAVKLRSRPKRWFLGPRFVGGWDTPDFGHAFSNYTYFRPCGQLWLSSVQRAPRVADEKKKERKNPPTILSGGLTMQLTNFVRNPPCIVHK